MIQNKSKYNDKVPNPMTSKENNSETKESKKNKKMNVASVEMNDNVDGSNFGNDHESLGEELEEVPVFYK
uniref:Uncharacterized protein n=1 Tax=Arion vulgaris TaxID=1028688 RepID=A0A0B6Z2X6_9EUPU